MRRVGDKAEKELELASGPGSFGCKKQRDTQAHFEKWSYFKKEMQKSPGERQDRDCKRAGFCGGWAAGSFI